MVVMVDSTQKVVDLVDTTCSPSLTIAFPYQHQVPFNALPWLPGRNNTVPPVAAHVHCSLYWDAWAGYLREVDTVSRLVVFASAPQHCQVAVVQGDKPPATGVVSKQCTDEFTKVQRFGQRVRAVYAAECRAVVVRHLYQTFVLVIRNANGVSISAACQVLHDRVMQRAAFQHRSYQQTHVHATSLHPHKTLQLFVLWLLQVVHNMSQHRNFSLVAKGPWTRYWRPAIYGFFVWFT